MKGILQYCSTDDGTYKNVFTERPRDNHLFTVEKIERVNPRTKVPTLIGYRCKIRAIGTEFNTDFLDNESWYFRYIFSTELTMIKLGSHYYRGDFDGLIKRNTKVFHTIHIEFTMSISDYDTYTSAENLPVSEGGVAVEDAVVFVSP